jgi:hypothetical protein
VRRIVSKWAGKQEGDQRDLGGGADPENAARTERLDEWRAVIGSATGRAHTPS